MQDHELDAWLGETSLTPEQRERLNAEVNDIATRYPDDDDDREERTAALSAAVQYLLGEITPLAAGGLLTRRRIEAAEALAAARQVARMSAQDGTAKAVAAREAGIDRMTLLTDLGEMVVATLYDRAGAKVARTRVVPGGVVTYRGRRYLPTGGSHSVGFQPMNHTYVEEPET